MPCSRCIDLPRVDSSDNSNVSSPRPTWPLADDRIMESAQAEDGPITHSG